MPQVPGEPTGSRTPMEPANEYFATIKAGREAPPSAPISGEDENPYVVQLEADKRRREQALAAALQPALATTPDAHAKNLALSKESGLPVGAVEADPASVEVEQRQRRILQAVARSPLLQAWAAQDDNAILAMDDFETLSGLEQAMRAVGDVAKAPLRGFNVSVGQGVQGLGRLNDAAARAITRGARALGLDAVADTLETPIPWWMNPSNWARSAGAAIERSGGAPLPEDRRNFATDVGEGLGTLIGQALVTRLNPTAGVSLMAGQGAEQSGRRADEAGATQEQADQASVLGAAITAASERLGLDLLLERMPPAIRNRAVRWIVDKTLAAGIEGSEEAVEQIGQNLVAQMIYDPDSPLFEGVGDQASVGAAVGFIARSLLGLRGVAHERGQVRGEQTALDGMVAAATASRLAQRAPERFEALAQEMAKAGAENVYVPAEAVQTLFQSMEPAQVAEALGVPVDAYAEAVITGGDVAIPVGTYLTRVAPQHHEALREVARFTPGAMTPAETAEVDERAKEAADRFMASVQSETPSDERVYDDVTGMLLGTGRYRRQDVERYAQLVQAGFRTLAAREGLDAFDLYSRYRLRIKAELPAALQAADIDTVIDPLIERLRAGDVPRGTKRQTLADFIAATGGVNDKAMTGEIKRLDESDRTVRRGKARLVRKDATRDLDRAREAAAEAGYLPADSDVNDLLNLLDEEMSGRPTYAMGDEADTPDDRTRAALDDLAEELDRRGIDVHKATNADIKRALFGENGTDVPDALVQVFDQAARAVDQTQTPEFKAWFGDSKVVDADGKPLVVYHGAPDARFMDADATFMSMHDRYGEKRGVGAFWFARDRSTAASYADYRRAFDYQNAEPAVIAAYLKLENPLVVDGGGKEWREAQAIGKTTDVIKKAQAEGHDGVIIRNVRDHYNNGPRTKPTDTYVVFDSRQIKSATGNRGTFDPNDPSILNQSLVDEATGLPINPDGTVTVYHHTNADAAEAIRSTGRLKSAGEPAVYVTTRRETDTGYGDTAVAVRVDPALLHIDDEFPDGRRDFRIDTGRPGGSVAVKVGEFSLDQSDRASKAIRRGYIKFGGDRQFTIGLLEHADATTFLHEVGHFFLEVMGDLAEDAGASPEIAQDYATLLQWFGVQHRSEIKTEHHEMFARAFEQYLGEGKAPTPELQSAFSRFKAWVKAIYRTLTALNVNLTDEVRGVMDRMLATDEEISRAEQSMDYAPLFADARSAGWSDAEFATRLRLQEQAREDAEARLMARAMRDVTRETKAWWKERLEDVTAEVRAEVEALPVYRAWALLANGTAPDGTPIEGAGQKLDKAWLLQQYGQEWLNKHLLRKRVYSVAGGADPDVVALAVGFESGDEMVKALANAQPMEAVIRAQAHQRMIDQYGDILSDGTMPEEAMRRVHSGKRFKALEADLRALERLAGEPRQSGRMLRQVAENIVSAKRVRDLQPHGYLRAERKAAKEAIKAAGQQKWGEALEAQRRRLLNAHLYDVASKAQAESEKLQRWIRRFEKPALRARLGKVGRLDQVEALLAQYDLRRLSGRQIDAGKARAALLAQIEAGEVVAPLSFVRSLQAGARTNWRDLTVEELRGLRDVLAQAEAVARAEYEALVNGERVQLDEVAEQIGASTLEGGKPVMPVYGELSPDETVKKWGKQLLSSWLRPSALARLLDGGKDDGAWTRHVIQPIRRAVTEVLEPMKRKAHDDLAALYRKHYTVKEMAAMNERSVVPGLGIPLSRWDVIALALNWGNAENRKAVLDSEVAGRKLYTEGGVRQALETLDARDWAFVQDVWDYIDSYWPAIKEAQRRRKGIAPPKVPAEPFTVATRDGQVIDLKGGYYPLKYNARLDARARQHEMDEAFERMRAGTLSAAQTKYGHTQERVGSGRQPVLLSMTVLHSHINNVVMDLALGDVIGYADRLLRRPQVRQALIETGNLDALETMKLWLMDTATGEIGARSGGEQMAQFLRFGFTKSKVGFNAMTVILQLTGLAQTIPVVGAGHTARAALDFAGRPRAAIQQVMAESAFMRTRYELNAFNKDIAAVQEALRSGAPVGKGSGIVGGFVQAVRAVQLPPKLVNWAFLGIRQTQLLVDATTWLAGYRRAAGEGKSHAEAVAYADGIVENAQTSGLFSDRSAIERGTLTESTRQSEFVKLWTTLMSYMIAKGNIAFESYRRTDFRSPTAVLAFGSDMLLLFAAEALLMGLIRGGLPDDDEDWWAWTGRTMGEQALSTIPFVREIPGMKYGGGNTPIGTTAGDLYKAVNQVEQGEFDQALVKSWVNLIGTATGLPSAQINRLIDAYWREQKGEDVPAYEYVTGKRRE